MNLMVFIIPAILILFITWRFFFFFRNPLRKSSAPENAILSPADGYVLYVRHINDPELEVFSIKRGKKILLSELMILRQSDLDLRSGWLIGITMSPLDVHYNRTPINGYIEKTGHEFPTPVKKNFSMFPALQNIFFEKELPYDDCQYLIQNERASYVISNSFLKIFVTQIADKYVKKIVSYKDKVNVERGEVFGLIRMGSQVDVFIPDFGLRINVVVREKQHLKAGIDIIAWICVK